MSAITIRKRVAQLIDQHGGLRPAARAAQIDVSYLSRLASGEKTEPSDFILRKLGLVKVVSYRIWASKRVQKEVA